MSILNLKAVVSDQLLVTCFLLTTAFRLYRFGQAINRVCVAIRRSLLPGGWNSGRREFQFPTIRTSGGPSLQEVQEQKTPA